MGSITLERRQSLSRRVQAFGSANGRGPGRYRVVGFGDALEMERAADRGSMASPAEARNIRDTTDWAAIQAIDPQAVESIFAMLNMRAGDGAAWQSLRDYMVSRGTYHEAPVIVPVPVTAPPVVTPPISVSMPSVTTSVSTVPATTADYQAAVAAAQVEAARLAAVATANAARIRAEAAQADAEAALAKQKAVDDAATSNVPVTPESNPHLWLIAALAAFLLLKG